VGERPRLQLLILALSLGGLALFYGDGLITPAISIMSAIEGLETATPVLAPYVLPLSALVLAALFLIQSRGTACVGTWFGPVACWC
jgi:KUP system potassium uptake protein